MGLIFLLAVVLAFALWWWQTGMVAFWEHGSGSDAPARAERSRLPPPEEVHGLPEPAPPEPVAATEFPMAQLAEKDRLRQLPPLDRSDGPIRESLAESFRIDALSGFVNMQDYVRRLVITVDNLPRELVPSQLSMVQRIPGPLDVRKEGDVLLLSPLNYARYDAFVNFVDSLDPRLLVGLYLRFYPLLDKTYKDIGYPQARFHDRVILAIDDMTAAPTPPEPIELVQPKVLYRFADPALQKLSAGQKIMVRVGPDNALQLKRALRRLRAELLGQPVS